MYLSGRHYLVLCIEQLTKKLFTTQNVTNSNFHLLHVGINYLVVFKFWKTIFMFGWGRCCENFDFLDFWNSVKTRKLGGEVSGCFKIDLSVRKVFFLMEQWSFLRNSLIQLQTNQVFYHREGQGSHSITVF